MTILEKLVAGFIGLVIVVMASQGIFAEVGTNWDDLENIRSSNIINYYNGTHYYPIQFYLHGIATSPDDGRRSIRSTLELGTPQNTTFDLSTVEGQKEWYQALPAILKPVAKDLRLQATDEDLSQ